MRALWGLTKWCGRVALWCTLPFIGMWRSHRHGRNQRHRELVEALSREPARTELPRPRRYV